MLALLQNIVQDVKKTSTLKEALDVLVSAVRKSFKTQACSIYLLDNKKSEYVLCATDGLNAELVYNFRFPIDEGLVGYVGRREEPINLDDGAQHPQFLLHPEIGEEKYNAFLGVPINHQRRLLGVLTVQQKEKRHFEKEEASSLMTLSAMLLADIIANAENTGELRELIADKTTHAEQTFVGIPSVAGVAIGQAAVVYAPEDLGAVPDRRTDQVENEITVFEYALNEVRKDIEKLRNRMAESIGEDELGLFTAYLQILDNSGLGRDVIKQIKKGFWAQSALRKVVGKYVAKFDAMEDEYLKERAADIRDLGRRLLNHIRVRQDDKVEYKESTILFSEEVTASMIAEVPQGLLAGIVSARGSANSHAAIIARSMGLPAVMGVKGLPLEKLKDSKVVVDGYFGQVYINPPQEILAEFTKLSLEDQELDESLESLRGLPAETPDGHRIKLFVNTGLASNAGLSMSVGAEGIGLYRSEVIFMNQDTLPSEEDQATIYRQLLKAFAPNRPVVMRTLDVGGDKQVPYFAFKEDNPFLGWRGIRITLDHPDIFLIQIRAMLRANIGFGNLKILLPMITNISEVDESKKLINQAHKELLEEMPEGDLTEVPFPEIGVMIEVPSAVYLARELAQKVDFLSVGSNDLIQYLLAVDRTNARVSTMYETFHPALIRALMHVVEQAHAEGINVSICGEMSSDPLAVVLLLAMGFDSLSMNSSSLPRVKWIIHNIPMRSAKKTLHEVLTMHDPAEIQGYLKKVLSEAGLGGLIRAGKH